MAGVTAYTGTQGSGKTYEVVGNVILPAVASGRRVVTNVAGLKVPEILAYCRDVLKAEKLGEIVSVSNDDVTRVEFFPVEESDLLYGRFVPIVQGGDVVVLDEVWRWYASGCALPDSHMKFIRMHRHFTNPETGVTCDIALLVQSIADLQRKVRAVVEKTFVMHKHKDLGMPNRYVVNIYGGSRINKTALINTIQCEYKPEIYNLYKSHSQSKAEHVTEVDADRRGNIFQNWRIKFLVPLALLMIVGAFFFMYRFFFHPKMPQADTQAAAGASVPVAGASVPAAATPSRHVDIGDDVRVVGFYVAHGQSVFLIADSLGRVRKSVNPVKATITEFETRVLLPDGTWASTWFAGSDARGREDKGGHDVTKDR